MIASALEPTPDEALDQYLAHLGMERNLSPKTIQSYQEDLRHWVAFMVELQLSFDALLPEHLDEHLQKCH